MLLPICLEVTYTGLTIVFIENGAQRRHSDIKDPVIIPALVSFVNRNLKMRNFTLRDRNATAQPDYYKVHQENKSCVH
jgi:hypothetical protein